MHWHNEAGEIRRAGRVDEAEGSAGHAISSFPPVPVMKKFIKSLRTAGLFQIPPGAAFVHPLHRRFESLERSRPSVFVSLDRQRSVFPARSANKRTNNTPKAVKPLVVKRWIWDILAFDIIPQYSFVDMENWLIKPLVF